VVVVVGWVVVVVVGGAVTSSAPAAQVHPLTRPCWHALMVCDPGPVSAGIVTVVEKEPSRARAVPRFVQRSLSRHNRTCEAGANPSPLTSTVPPGATEPGLA
jgi:hypothetical protein